MKDKENELLTNTQLVASNFKDRQGESEREERKEGEVLEMHFVADSKNTCWDFRSQ